MRGAVVASSNDRGQGDTGSASDGSRLKAEADPADLLPRSDISPQVLHITFDLKILLCQTKWQSVVCVLYPLVPAKFKSHLDRSYFHWSLDSNFNGEQQQRLADCEAAHAGG